MLNTSASAFIKSHKAVAQEFNTSIPRPRLGCSLVVIKYLGRLQTEEHSVNCSFYRVLHN